MRGNAPEVRKLTPERGRKAYFSVRSGPRTNHGELAHSLGRRRPSRSRIGRRLGSSHSQRNPRCAATCRPRRGAQRFSSRQHVPRARDAARRRRCRRRWAGRRGCPPNAHRKPRRDQGARSSGCRRSCVGRRDALVREAPACGRAPVGAPPPGRRGGRRRANAHHGVALRGGRAAGDGVAGRRLVSATRSRSAGRETCRGTAPVAAGSRPAGAGPSGPGSFSGHESAALDA